MDVDAPCRVIARPRLYDWTFVQCIASRLVAFAAALLGSSCGSDVIVGINPVADATASDSGPATADAELADAGADVSSGDGAGPLIETGALAAASQGASGWLVAGHAGGPTGNEASSDAWWRFVAADGAGLAEQRVDVAGGSDRITAALAYPDGGYVVAGTTTTGASTPSIAWLRRLRPDGSELWTRTFDDGANPMTAEALALGTTGTIIVAGNEGSPTDGWVARVQPDGTLAFRLDLRGTGGKGTRVFAVGVSQLDHVFAGGQRTLVTDAGVVDAPTILQVGPLGDLFNSSTSRFAAGTTGTVRGVMLVAPDTFVLCADTNLGPSVARIDGLFTKSEVYTYATPFPTRLAGCAFATDGSVLLGGTAGAATGAAPWLAKHDLASFAPRWTRSPAVARPTSGLTVAAGAGGVGLLAGRSVGPSAAWWSVEAP